MNDLKLTDEEIKKIVEFDDRPWVIADAATAKAAWKVISRLGEWLDYNYPLHQIDIGEIAGGKCPHCVLAQELRDDGFPYPEKLI